MYGGGGGGDVATGGHAITGAMTELCMLLHGGVAAHATASVDVARLFNAVHASGSDARARMQGHVADNSVWLMLL
jgi:hypothetical protein